MNTSYTNLVKTTKSNSLHEKLQKPVYEPLLHGILALSPIVRGLSWLGYQSGLAQLQTASSSFAGAETREQLDFVSKYYYCSSPAVVARGMLGMLHWDCSDALDRIGVPVLIVSGNQDITTLPFASDYMSAKIRNDSRLSVRPAAHLWPIEQHERYNTAVETFVSAQLRGTEQARK